MKVFYRIYQGVFNIAIRIASNRKYNVISGDNSLLKVCDMLKDSDKDCVMVVTTPGFIKRGTLEPFFEKLKATGIKAVIFSDVTPDPTIDCVEKAYTAYTSSSCKAIVAIGGGSVIDCAKIAAARAVCPKKSVRQMKGMLKIHKTLPDFYAVPTTAGTGSEATAAAVITDTVDGVHYKYPITDFCIIPKFAVLDPCLTLSLPQGITAATGMDALTHAVEAYTNRFKSKLVKKNAKSAVKLIYENLQVAYNDGKNIKARENMLLSSFYAGVAFTNNFVGYIHAVAHALGGLYGIAHGMANAIVLPYVMEMFGKSVYKPLSELADVAGISGATSEEKAKNFIESIRKMNREMNLPDKVVQLKRDDFNTIIDRAIKEGNPNYPVPVIWGRKDFAALLEKLIVE